MSASGIYADLPLSDTHDLNFLYGRSYYDSYRKSGKKIW